MQITTEQIQAAVAVLGILGTAIAFLGGLLWKISAWAKSVSSRVEDLSKATEDLAKAAKANHAASIKLSEKIVELSTLIRERERESAKLEGKLEAATAEVSKAGAGLVKLGGQVAFLQATLQKLHPQAIPKRTADG